MNGILNFGGLCRVDLPPEGARFSVIPVPYDLTTSYVSGARNGPRAIIEASAHMELYDEELNAEPCRAGIETLGALEPTAAGPEEMIGRVEASTARVLDKNGIPVILGGEHSITLGAIRACKKRHPDLSVLQLDAHADMRDTYQDNPFNHACVARRISEICHVVQAGIRSLSLEESLFLKSGGTDGGPVHNVKTYFAADMAGKALPEGVGDRVAEDLGEEIFITVDLDVFDPSIMPATGTPEPGGPGWYEVLGVLRRVVGQKRVVGFDVVELSPIAGIVAPDFLAARLVYKIMAYINESMKG